MGIGTYRSRHGVAHVSMQFDNRGMAEAEMLDAGLRKAWDQLCDQSSWRYWHQGIRDDLTSADTFYFMHFDENRDAIGFRRTKDGLNMYIPLRHLRAMRSNAERVDYLRDVYLRFFERYATVREIDPPPVWTG
ncbi:hypothetical protein [Nocardioides sp. CCNWLW212]|uniref:hypothetical protein n=1 Tax=Nocardioides sp. CCNWLW212 TaxID=3128897 RepID=UPI00307D2D19